MSTTSADSCFRPRLDISVGAQRKDFECVWQYGHYIHESQIVAGDVICWVSGQDDQNERQNALPFWNLL